MLVNYVSIQLKIQFIVHQGHGVKIFSRPLLSDDLPLRNVRHPVVSRHDGI